MFSLRKTKKPPIFITLESFKEQISQEQLRKQRKTHLHRKMQLQLHYTHTVKTTKMH